MKPTSSKTHQLKTIGLFFGNIARAIVSGFPRTKLFIRPEKITPIQERKDRFNYDSEKHYHHPHAKPVVEKQTLLKEKKKVKGSSKQHKTA